MTVSDAEAVAAMRELAALGLRDRRLRGRAAGRAARADDARPEGGELRAAAGLDRAGARVLLVATEGVTDPAGYAAAVPGS